MKLWKTTLFLKVMNKETEMTRECKASVMLRLGKLYFKYYKQT